MIRNQSMSTVKWNVSINRLHLSPFAVSPPLPSSPGPLFVSRTSSPLYLCGSAGACQHASSHFHRGVSSQRCVSHTSCGTSPFQPSCGFWDLHQLCWKGFTPEEWRQTGDNRKRSGFMNAYLFPMFNDMSMMLSYVCLFTHFFFWLHFATFLGLGTSCNVTICSRYNFPLHCSHNSPNSDTYNESKGDLDPLWFSSDSNPPSPCTCMHWVTAMWLAD